LLLYLFRIPKGWDGATNFGSYTILFKTNNVYDGKGGGQDRCKVSAQLRCQYLPDIADFQAAPDSFAKPEKTTNGTTLSSLEVQAFKEEAIRMEVSSKGNNGGVLFGDYNKAQSPGVNYIKKQGW
jgi:hypothetical protein